jgi:hypothetical protein
MVTVTARESFNYAGIDREKGQSFEASPEDARILRLIGKVDDAPSDVPAAPFVDEHDADAATVPARRRYQRKDIVAE